LAKKKISNTQNLALKAIKRELNIEKLLAQELRLKSELEARNLLSLKKQEQKKKDCLEKAFKDRELEDERMRDNKSAEDQIQRIKDEAKKEVEKKRNDLRNKLADIRKRFGRRKHQIEQDINVIRSQMAQNLLDANKNGDMMKCRQAYGIEDKINFYCNANLVDDFSKNVSCKDPNSFCYICCENEFGNMFMDKRDKCYNMCDDLARAALDHGEFIWGAQPNKQ